MHRRAKVLVTNDVPTPNGSHKMLKSGEVMVTKSAEYNLQIFQEVQYKCLYITVTKNTHYSCWVPFFLLYFCHFCEVFSF